MAKGSWRINGTNGEDHDSQWVPENEEYSGNGPPSRRVTRTDWKTVATLLSVAITIGGIVAGIARVIILADVKQLISDHATAAAVVRTNNTNEILTLKQRCAEFSQWRSDTNGLILGLLDNRTECKSAIASAEEYRRSDDARMTRLENQLNYLLQQQQRKQ